MNLCKMEDMLGERIMTFFQTNAKNMYDKARLFALMVLSYDYLPNIPNILISSKPQVILLLNSKLKVLIIR